MSDCLQTFEIIRYMPAHMNSVIVKIWKTYTIKSLPFIVHTFNENNPFPIPPPQSHNTTVANHACTAQM